MKLILEFILRYRSYEKKSKFFIHSIQKADFDWLILSLSDKNKMKRNCFDNSHKLSPFFFLLTEINKKTWSLIVKCRSSCSWNQIKTVCSVNRRYFVFQLASGITFKHLDLVAKFLGSNSSKSTFLLQIFKIQMSFKNIIFSANSAKNSSCAQE